ncbi:class I SAM-dependent methyltransferase [Marimonas lutisalis]|uniref:class I SAM-dependent methyltransferase n=1 Tax=Marimonas lutisalis TaxID=2545756 RepID=UPI0010F7DFA4|nr:class I SAM-dependent methyltransferase [Marimonas lutisalis]
MDLDEIKKVVSRAVQESSNRLELWEKILNAVQPSVMCEVGVWKGGYARHILDNVPGISKYIFVDPWRNLPNWNKPANVSNEVFDEIRAEALAKNKRHSDVIEELRMTTKEAVAHIDETSIDFAYIDGDHTLRGITIDLISILPRIKPNGLIGGDDFTKNIWQHSDEFDPTEVFPFAIYFAEANDLAIFTLPFNQFLIVKTDHFEVIDLARYAALTPRRIYTRREPQSPNLRTYIMDIFKKAR